MTSHKAVRTRYCTGSNSALTRQNADVKLTLLTVQETGRVFVNERGESVGNQHNLFRNMLYYNNETTCFGL